MREKGGRRQISAGHFEIREHTGKAQPCYSRTYPESAAHYLNSLNSLAANAAQWHELSRPHRVHCALHVHTAELLGASASADGNATPRAYGLLVIYW